MTLNVRAGIKSDSDDIAKLIKQLAEEFIIDEFNEAGRQHFLNSNNAKAIVGFMAHGFEYFVAEDSGEIVGTVGIRDNSHLYHLFVAKEYQGKGLSRRLWELAKVKCFENGNDGKFTVNSSNNAVGIYESFGFKRVAPMAEIKGVLYNPMVLEVSS